MFMAARMLADILLEDLPVPEGMIRVGMGLEIVFQSALAARFPFPVLLVDNHLARHLLFNEFFPLEQNHLIGVRHLCVSLPFPDPHLRHCTLPEPFDRKNDMLSSTALTDCLSTERCQVGLRRGICPSWPFQRQQRPYQAAEEVTLQAVQKWSDARPPKFFPMRRTLTYVEWGRMRETQQAAVFQQLVIPCALQPAYWHQAPFFSGEY